MSDSTSGPLNPVDQGTVFMLSLSFAALAIAFVYFACLWYRKRRQARTQHTTTTPKTTDSSKSKSKSNVARSFSRFSQVDEELTFVAPDETDLAAATGPSSGAHAHSASPKRNRQINRSRAATTTMQTRVGVSPATKTTTTREFRKSAPPGDRVYLETSI